MGVYDGILGYMGDAPILDMHGGQMCTCCLCSTITQL